MRAKAGYGNSSSTSTVGPKVRLTQEPLLRGGFLCNRFLKRSASRERRGIQRGSQEDREERGSQAQFRRRWLQLYPTGSSELVLIRSKGKAVPYTHLSVTLQKGGWLRGFLTLLWGNGQS